MSAAGCVADTVPHMIANASTRRPGSRVGDGGVATQRFSELAAKATDATSKVVTRDAAVGVRCRSPRLLTGSSPKTLQAGWCGLSTST